MKFIKRVLQQFLVSLLSTVMWIFVMVGLLVLIAVVSSQQSRQNLKPEGALVLDLGVSMSDKPGPEIPRLLRELVNPAQSSVSLYDVLRSIEHAKTDDAIEAILIVGNLSEGMSTTGLAGLEELRAKLESFKQSTKPIYAYVERDSQLDYYIKSVADTLWGHPFGEIKLKGFAISVPFWRELMDRLGVEVQVFKRGAYKSAAEGYERREMSPENRIQRKAYLESIWGSLGEKMAKSRSQTADSFNAIANERFQLMNPEAAQMGLFDGLIYFDELLEEMEERVGSQKEDKTFKQTHITKYIAHWRNVRADSGDERNQIALIYGEGTIMGQGADLDHINSLILSRKLRALRKDEKVKAVVLRLNTPGGEVLSGERIRREVELISKVKPIVVSMGAYAASGGYWISSAANEIFANESTLTGSIGVLGAYPHIQGLSEKAGVNWGTVKTHLHADGNSLYRPLSQDEQRQTDQVVEDLYGTFKQLVSKGRNLDENEVEAYAQGRIWSGKDALEIGLVDQIGGIEAALDRAAVLAALEPGSYRIDEVSDQENPLRRLTKWGQRMGLFIKTLTQPGIIEGLKGLGDCLDRSQTKGPQLSVEPLRLDN